MLYLFTMLGLNKCFSSIYLKRLLFHSIQINGCFTIKLAQWVCARNDIIENKALKFDKIFSENSIHDINFTKTQYIQDFNENFDDNYEILGPCISSGSIAQVYKVKDKNTNEILAIKVRHPNVDKNMNFQVYIFKKLIYFVNYFNIESPINVFNYLPINSFIETFKKQIDFKHESLYVDKFYQFYKDNTFVITPKLIKSSDNFIIMSYEDSTPIYKIDNFLQIHKCVTLFQLFCTYTAYYCKCLHCDLHYGNWGVRDNKIVIYDFGYIYDLDDRMIQNMKDWRLHYENQNLDDMKKIMVENWCSPSLNMDSVKNNGLSLTKPINMKQCLHELIPLAKKFNVEIKECAFQNIIFFNCIEKIVRDSLNIESHGTLEINSYRKDMISFCDTFEIFPELSFLLKSYTQKSSSFENIDTNDVICFYNNT